MEEVKEVPEVEKIETVTIKNRCFVCASDMHIENIGGYDWWVCDDPLCQWMKPA